MFIKRLEIDNFKSFANLTVIDFRQGFTAIAGINGSGKSNIIDSILFALGLQTARALRTEKGLADLVSTHNNRNEASVKVVFDLEDGVGGELSIERKIKKTSSGYVGPCYVNGKNVTVSQMQSELEKYSITPNGYNVVMQGEVLRLAECSNTEKRKFIDEVAGTADFDRKIDTANNELEAVEKRVQDSSLVLNLVKEQLEKLREDREIALKYQELRNQKKELESQITTVKYFDFKKILENMHDCILKATKEKKQQEINLSNKEEEITVKQKEFDEISAKVKAQGEDKQLEVKGKIQETNNKIQAKKDSINYTNNIIQRNKKTIYNATNGIKEIEGQKEKLKATIKEKEDEKTNLEKEMAEKKLELENVLKEVTGLNKTANTYIEKRNALRKELDSLKDEENSVLRDKIPYEGKLENLNKEMTDVNEQIENIKSRIASFDDDKTKLEDQVRILNDELNELKTTNRAYLEEIDKLNNQLKDDNHSINLANQKIAQLEADKRAFKAYGQDVGVETIMQSNMAGVIAPLSKLAEVEGEYITAIAEAMGGRSNFVVVEDENVASRAIELLKSQDRGRATFLPLTKLKPAPSSLPLQKTPGVIDYAINLIDFDDKYLKAFFFALGDTLVVDNMQTAKKLMGKYRIVTVDGEIFEKSGAITGGKKRRARVSFGSSDDKELQTYIARLEELKREFYEKESKKTQYEQRLEKIREDAANAQTSLNGAKFEYNQLIKSHDEFEKVLEEKLKRINEIAPEINKTETLLDKLEQKHSTILEKSLKTQEEIDEVEKFIDDGALKRLQEATSSVENAIKELEKKIDTIGMEVFKLEKTIEFNNDMITTQTNDIKRLTEENEGLEQDILKFEINIKEFEDGLVVLEEEVQELEKNLAELKKIRDEVQETLNNAKDSKRELEFDISRIADSIEAFKNQRAEIEPQLEEIVKELKENNIKTEELTPTEMTAEEITGKIQKLQKKMDDMGNVNMRSIEDYNEVQNKEKELNTRIETLENEKNEIQSRMKGYEDLKKETFLKTFNFVNGYFKEIFTELTDGYGELILENEENPFLGGLTIKANQKDKDKQKLKSMSGGEKTLMALSMIFAVQKHMPAPFYALDEVDAALDGFNVERIGRLIIRQADKTQFVVISQRQQMIENAARMIGVSQSKGRTKVTGISKIKEEA